ncbi:MAG TPA: DUF6048 family protein [Flavobacterium sp.]|jgi:hypothetical protein
MRRTSAFIFSIAMMCIASAANAQQTQNDTVPVKTERYGLRVGVDLYKLARSLYDEDYKGLEIVGDYRLTKKIYLAAEIGNENKTTDDDRQNFTTKGTYIKGGFDYNTYENWLDMENMIHVGLRYSFSSFSQELNSYRVYNTSQYFGESQQIISGQEFDSLTASWLEVVAGMKVEVFDNIYIGFSARLYRIVSNKQPGNFENLYIPGFGRTYGGDFGAGFNYTVSYFIPIYKKKLAPKKVEQKK